MNLSNQNMKQSELFPENKIFSHSVIVFWLSSLTITLLLFILFFFISFILFPSKDDSSKSFSFNDLRNQITKLEEEVNQLKISVSTLIEDPKESKTEFKASATEPSSPKNFSTQDFETYQSTNYQFKIKYPKTWKVEKESGASASKLITDANISMVGFISESNSKVALFPEGGFEKQITETPENTMKITLGGKTATRNIYKNGMVIILFDDFNNFRIEYDPYHKNDQEIFEAILETLSFS